jgi:lysophospholipase L1-like esterase
MFHSLYGKELMTRIDPVYSQTSITTKTTKFLFIGDSRIAFWEIPDTIIKREYLLNLGIEAQTTAQVLYRAKDYFNNYHADYTFIQVGINDLKTIGFYPNKYDYIIKETCKNILALLNVCLDHQSQPVYISIFPTGQVEVKRRLFWNSQINKAIRDVNFEVIQYCNSIGIKTINSSQILSTNGNLVDKDFQKDCLHLNSKGYEKLNIELNEFLEKNELK